MAAITEKLCVHFPAGAAAFKARLERQPIFSQDETLKNNKKYSPFKKMCS